jgi:hypothetical protein
MKHNTGQRYLFDTLVKCFCGGNFKENVVENILVAQCIAKQQFTE